VRRVCPGLAACALLAACGGDAEPPAPAAPAAAPASSDSPSWFRDATAASGLDFVHDAGMTEEKHLPETMGAGAALFDANGDGALDVYCVQSGPMPVGAAAVRTEDMPRNRLFLGDGRGKLRDATAAARDAAHAGYGMGAAAGDADGDGDVDLYVASLGPDAYFVGAGDGSFAEATGPAGLGDERWNVAPLFFDSDQDGDLDLYVTGYVEIDLEHPTWCGDRRPGWRSYCHPDNYAGIADRMYRNRGDGTFADETEAAGLADNLGKGLGVIACDLDDDGDLELFIANDSTGNKLWVNQGDGTFADDTLFSGTGVSREGATQASMGIAVGDADGDLDFEILVTNFDDESDTLYRNDGGGLFTDATIPFGLEAPSLLPVGFGCVFEDFDLDGDLDLAVANGHIIDNIHLYHDGKTWRQEALFYVNEGQRFRADRGAGGDLVREPLVGRGLYSGDLDGDGAPDLLLTQCNGPARLYLNENGARAPGKSVVVRGLPPGTQVEAELPDGRRVLRQAGAAISYAGHGEEAVYLPAGARGLRVREPGGAWRDH
jgi:enediyne biosynthesis protein E4